MFVVIWHQFDGSFGGFRFFLHGRYSRVFFLIFLSFFLGQFMGIIQGVDSKSSFVCVKGPFGRGKKG